MQQQLNALNHRLGVEAFDHTFALQVVGQRQHDHALMVGHVGADNGVLLPQPQVAGGEVERFVKAIATKRLVLYQSLHVCQDGLRRQWQRHKRGIGGNDQIIGETALEAQTGCTKGAILIVHGRIKGVEARFRDAPRYVAARGVGNLLRHCRVTTLVEQRVGVAAHKERRHEIFKHGAAP